MKKCEKFHSVPSQTAVVWFRRRR